MIYSNIENSENFIKFRKIGKVASNVSSKVGKKAVYVGKGTIKTGLSLQNKLNPLNKLLGGASKYKGIIIMCVVFSFVLLIIGSVIYFKSIK